MTASKKQNRSQNSDEYIYNIQHLFSKGYSDNQIVSLFGYTEKQIAEARDSFFESWNSHHPNK